MIVAYLATSTTTSNWSFNLILYIAILWIKVEFNLNKTSKLTWIPEIILKTWTELITQFCKWVIIVWWLCFGKHIRDLKIKFERVWDPNYEKLARETEGQKNVPDREHYVWTGKESISQNWKDTSMAQAEWTLLMLKGPDRGGWGSCRSY